MTETHEHLQRIFRALAPKTARKYQFFATSYSVMQETFFEDQYRFLVQNLKNHTIAIDIGANIGDSSIYLARCPKIERVYAFEPFYYLFKEALFNAKLSRLEDKILLSQKLVMGDKNGKIPDNMANREYRFIGNADEHNFSSITLPDIIEGIKAKYKTNPIIIKCDIEGEEYNVFTKDLDYSKIYKLQIEYHRKSPVRITSILKLKGFRCKTLKEKAFGQIFAERVD
jgi:FkbM family methyltransferase